MSVRVCDVITGGGKTSAAITEMNTNVDKRYIFVTPYLKEIDRIKLACAEREFISPERTYKDGFSKLNHLHALMESGYNIVCTHALFSYYTDETVRMIKEQDYTLIMDEVFEVIEEVDFGKPDLKLIIDSGILKRNGDLLEWSGGEDDYVELNNIYLKAKTHDLVVCRDVAAFWMFPIKIFKAFNEIIILTYLFRAQIQSYYFLMNGVEFEYISARKTDSGYEFCEVDECNFSVKIKDKVHVCCNEKLNEIGDTKFAQSASWYRQNSPQRKKDLTRLKNNIYNFFRSVNKKHTDTTMWTTFKKHKDKVKGKGYTKAFVSCNLRASNEFRDKNYLAYCINVFMQPYIKGYFQDHGMSVDEDLYALSEMVQWIWRSAIRDGEDIWIYVPNIRMRGLLEKWLDEVDKGNYGLL